LVGRRGMGRGGRKWAGIGMVCKAKKRLVLAASHCQCVSLLLQVCETSAMRPSPAIRAAVVVSTNNPKR
jgi:hypothetical protein